MIGTYGGPSHVTIELGNGKIIDLEGAVVEISMQRDLSRDTIFGAPEELFTPGKQVIEATIRSLGPVTMFEGQKEFVRDTLDDDEFKCDYCRQVNPITNYYCHHCGSPRPLKYELRERRNETR
jgi:hypothetical protein